MARVYSAQFSLGHDSNEDVPQGPEPNQLWIIRQVLVYSGNSESTGLHWQLTELSTSTIVLYLPFPDLKIGTEFFTGRIVIPYPQTVQWTSAADIGDSGVDVYMGGYILAEP